MKDFKNNITAIVDFYHAHQVCFFIFLLLYCVPFWLSTVFF